MTFDDVNDANGFNGFPREVLLDPFGNNDYWATMRAVVAVDQPEPGVPLAGVEYYFECIDDEFPVNSGWQSSPTYTVRIGPSGQGYRFRVRARDTSAAKHDTDWSDPYPAY
jgi:hypothetical protein